MHTIMGSLYPLDSRIFSGYAVHMKRNQYQREWRLKNPEYAKLWRKDNPDKLREASKRRWQAHLDFLAAIKVAPCLDCGGNFPPEAMDFDHVMGTKIRTISNMHNFSRERVLQEIEKCELVCANCHRVRTKKRNSIME